MKGRSNNIKEDLFIKSRESGGDKNEKILDCFVKDDIEIPELKYSAEGELMKSESVSSEVQLRNDFSFRNDEFEFEVSKVKFEILESEPKMESDDYVLKEEISINDVIDDGGCYEFKKYPERDSDTQSLCNDNEEVKQKLDKCSSLDHVVAFSSRNDDFEKEESKLEIDTMPFEPKTESVDYILKEEISINDLVDDVDSYTVEGYCEKDSDAQLCKYSEGIKQTCNKNSLLGHKVPTETSKDSYFGLSFSRESSPEMEQKQLNLTKKSIEQEIVSRNNDHQLKKINEGFRCCLCPFQNQLEAEVKIHFKNYHYSAYSRLFLDEIVYDENSDKFEKQFRIKLLKCLDCNYKTNHNGNFRKHLKRHIAKYENDYLKCEQCDYKTTNEFDLKKHFMVHSDECKLYKCEQCDFKSIYKSSLKSHLMVHSDECYLHKCEHCDYQTKYKSTLRKHLMVHSDSYILHKCEQCDYKTKHKCLLKTHLFVHSDDCHPYKCEHCAYKTKFKFELKKHLKVHSKESELYKCERCSYKTIHKSALKAHLIVHSDASHPYKCQHCNYVTKYKSNLRKHLIVHSDASNNRHKCEHCDYKTKYKYNLKTHLKVHSADDHLYCQHCAFKTKYKSCLKKHLMVHSIGHHFDKCEQSKTTFDGAF